MARPRKPVSKQRVGLAVYLDPPVLRLLKSRAVDDRRSASTQAALYIEEGLGVRPAPAPRSVSTSTSR